MSLPSESQQSLISISRANGNILWDPKSRIYKGDRAVFNFKNETGGLGYLAAIGNEHPKRPGVCALGLGWCCVLPAQELALGFLPRTSGAHGLHEGCPYRLLPSHKSCSLRLLQWPFSPALCLKEKQRLPLREVLCRAK